METWVSLGLIVAVLVMPVAHYRRTRHPGESPRQWLRRYEPVEWESLRRDLLRSAVVRPAWWLRYMAGVVAVTWFLPMAMALFSLVSGQWRAPDTAATLAGLWFELTLVLSVTVFLRIMQWRAATPAPLSWALVGRWFQVALYALAGLQAYGALVDKTQLTGLNRLVLWRWL